MELPARAQGDQLLPSGEHTDIRRRLKAVAARHDLTTVIACAFDHRTRMLPFFYADRWMAPAGVRAVGSALVDSGFDQTRIVLQQWNRNFRPSRMRLDGRLPDLFLISSMSLHSAACKDLIRDVCLLDPAQRPLVIVGGPLCIYQPWEAFYTPPVPPTPATSSEPAAADLAITGEEYVLLHLLETLLSGRAGHEPLRQTFIKARESGALDAIPGLVYPRLTAEGHVAELIDTGRQRLLADLDELPFPTAGYGILEPPGRSTELAARPLDSTRVQRHTPIASLVMTFGCRFSCEYCPIPAYNQKHLRGKSGPRVAEEIYQLYHQYGLRHLFGTDDNFFSNHQRALEIVQSLASLERDGLRLGRKLRWGTEVTVHDTLQMREHIPLMHRAGMRALWLGVEDMSGTLVRKGQGVDKTTEAFTLLRQNGICPMPMLMHHDAQPLLTPGRPNGLLNQVNLLRKAGAVSLQVLMLIPATGSRSYERTFTSGLVYQSVAGRIVEPIMFDGNFVIATQARRPWQKQLNLLLAYLFFYNPLWLLIGLFKRRDRVGARPLAMQILGMWGLLYTIRRTLGWTLRLAISRGRGTRCQSPPASPWPIHTATKEALASTPAAEHV